MKKIINYLLLFVLMITTISAADFYTTYDVAFSSDRPSSIYVDGAGCSDFNCNDINTNSIELFNGDLFSTCWETYISNNDVTSFNSCISSAKITGNIIDLNQMNRITVKENTDNVYGTLIQFFTSDDSYLPKFSKTGEYNCEFDVCVDTTLTHLNFEKKSNAIAEIGQLNIINLDDKLKPVQIEVPVRIDETICSAFRFTDLDMYKFIAPSGYADYSALTNITLTISDEITNNQYTKQSITLPIEADSCAGLAAFSWTAPSGIDNSQIKFDVETDVIDNQVSSSIIDFTNVIETIYPQDLNNTAWTRAYDFTLSNTIDFDLTTSIAQISEGETLFALFRAAAFAGNEETPIDFRVSVLFNDSLVYSDLLFSGENLVDYSFDLSNTISNLPAGTYNVTLITTPLGVSYDIAESVIQTQKLEILSTQTFFANFFVEDIEGNALDNANINLELISADDYYQTTPTFNVDVITNNLGYSVFNDLISGDYKYTISKDGYTSVTNNIRIASNSDIYITIPGGNTAPTVAMPESFTAYYQDEIRFKLTDYINDFNDDFSDLLITTSLISGNVVRVIDGDEMVFTTNAPNTAQVEIFAQDASGLVSSDIVTIYFTDNSAPTINLFEVTSTNGAAPFTTQFTAIVSDEGEDPLCTIDFGDGLSQTGACSTFQSISHTYTSIGTFNAKLSVDDGSNPIIEQTIQIFVFERQYESPIIENFNLESSNGAALPTDLTLTWSTSHSADYPMTCEIRYLGNVSSVPCDGTLLIPDYRVEGISEFHLIVTDNESIQIVRTITKAFGNEALVMMLDNDNTKLIIDDVVSPGEFKFSIESIEEIVDERTFSLTPSITCNDITYTLNGPTKTLLSGGKSKMRNYSFIFDFKSNTLDYTGNIPTDTLCTFSVELNDDYYSNFKLSKDVTFSYPEEVKQLQSIRGKSTDIVSFMESIVREGGFNNGYNSMQFILENNNFDEKDLTITVTALDLDLEQTVEENLGPGEEIRVQIPVYIKESIEPGLYPVRISAYDGTDKQVRYSYIRIE